MIDPTDSILAQASDALAGGAKMKVVLSTVWADESDPDVTGTLSYSQLWLYHTRRFLADAEKITATEGSDEWFKAITTARNAEAQSWGYIAVRCGQPEGRVRAAYAKATGLRSQGLRINHGGRFLDTDPLLYLETAKATGTAIPTTAKRSEFRNYANTLENVATDELRRRLRLLGRKDTGSRSVLVKRLNEVTAPANA